MGRYAAKLLFQFRVDVNGDTGKRRLCEERIINFSAGSPQQALRTAKRRGKQGQHAYTNSDGNTVTFEFIGVWASKLKKMKSGTKYANVCCRWNGEERLSQKTVCCSVASQTERNNQ
jgi:hypothetical protein